MRYKKKKSKLVSLLAHWFMVSEGERPVTCWLVWPKSGISRPKKYLTSGLHEYNTQQLT